MEHSEETRSSAFTCLTWLGIGVAVVVLTVLLLWVFMGLWARHIIVTMLNTPQPPARTTGAFEFPGQDAAECLVPLPDGGSLVYVHVLGDGRGRKYAEGERAVRFQTGANSGRVRPLHYYHLARTRVGFYWYPERDGVGPFVRVYDSCGESVVDLQRDVTRALSRSRDDALAGDYDLNQHGHGGISYTVTNGKRTDVCMNGQPAEDVSQVFGDDKGRYLGSVVRHGDRLRLHSAVAKR